VQAGLDKCLRATILSEFLKQSLIFSHLRPKNLLVIWKVLGKYKFKGINTINSRIGRKSTREKVTKALKPQYFR